MTQVTPNRFEFRTAQSLGAILCVAMLLAGDRRAYAQQAPPPSGQVVSASGTTSAVPAADAAEAKLPPEALDALIAPIALYPDPLLSQVLVASTYPLEIVQLSQWLEKNSALKDKALAAAVDKEDWDPSIKSMAGLPDVVKRMKDNIKWTTDLGNAMLAQQSDLMDAAQRMRAKAKEKGALQSNEQQTVQTKVVESKTVIVVEPAKTEVVYVPSYNPVVVYGAPMYPIYPYPPMVYPPYYAGAALVGFGVGIAVGAAIGGGWGYGCGWGGNNNVNVNVNNNYNRNTNINRGGGANGNGNWQHNGNHRGGVPYQNKSTASKYNGSARGDSMSSRQAKAGGQGGASASNRAGGGANASNRAGGGPGGGASASNRASGGGGGERMGSRDVPSNSSRGGGNSGGFGGSSSGASARSSSQRGNSSMGSSSRSSSGGSSRGGGGGRSGGGGGRRR